MCFSNNYHFIILSLELTLDIGNRRQVLVPDGVASQSMVRASCRSSRTGIFRRRRRTAQQLFYTLHVLLCSTYIIIVFMFA